MAERGTYRSISCSLLSGKDFRKLPERPRWIFVVLKLNIGQAGIDTWYPDELLSRLVSESGASADQVKLALDYLEHENWIEREDNVIWVKGHITHDPHLTPANPKHRKAVQRQIAGLPRLEIVRHFCLAHPEWVPPVEASVMGIGWVSEPIAEGMAYKSRSRNRIRIRKEDTEKEKERGNNPASPSPFPMLVSDALHQAWVKKRGAVDYATFRKALKPLFPASGGLYTTEALIAAIECYSDVAEAQTPKESGFWTIHKFAADISRWVRLGAMPQQLPDGTVTERGRLVAGLAA